MPAYFAKDQTPATPAKRQRTSIIDRRSHQEKVEAAKKLQSGRPPLRKTTPRKKNPEQHAKRVTRNREYYASAEWRAKRKLVFERDGYRCVEMIPYVIRGGGYFPDVGTRLRCPNMGMNINGKQTAKGLVCEEVSYGHRGIPDRIDTCKTRCKECDWRLTPLERANHAQGFRK